MLQEKTSAATDELSRVQPGAEARPEQPRLGLPPTPAAAAAAGSGEQHDQVRTQTTAILFPLGFHFYLFQRNILKLHSCWIQIMFHFHLFSDISSSPCLLLVFFYLLFPITLDIFILFYFDDFPRFGAWCL